MLQRLFLSIRSGGYNERWYNEWMLQRTVFIHTIWRLQRTMIQRVNATTNSFYPYDLEATTNDDTTSECYNELFLSIRSGGYNKRWFNEWMLQQTVFINKIRRLHRTRRNTSGRRSMRVRMTCRAFRLWLERQSSSLLSYVRFSYQFSSVICLF